MPSLDLGPVVGPQGEQGATGAQGIRGEQGLPGPNQVTNSTATPLTGVLTGNGSVVGVESIDAAPTPDSTGFATSGGTDKAIKGRVPVYGKGKNLLDNGAFVVNQRGVTSGSLSVATYVRDRWVMNLCSYTFNDDGSVTYAKTTANDAFLIQYTSHDLHGWLVGKTVTVSAVVDGEIQKVTITMPANNNTWTLGGGVTLRIYTNYYGDASKERYEFQFYHSNTSGVRFGPVMAELGEESTLGHIENGTVILNSSPDYEYELFRCMTSTADSTDTYANKTLATGEEIAKVLHDPAGQNVAVGEYAIYNGQIYQANTAITSSMAASTFASYLTDVPGGGLNSLTKNKLGFYTDVSTYTQNAKYIASQDGYLTLLANGASSYVVYSVGGSDDTNSFSHSASGTSALAGFLAYSVLVRKGMKIWLTASAGEWLARFFPLIN